jgi:chromosomal replication initiator protein
MHAIGHYILKNSKKKVLYVTSEMFTNEFISVIDSDQRKGSRGSDWRKKFRDKYRKTDILLIDDIQFLEGKEATINEFFNTFEALIARNKQIIITSDRSPEQSKLDDRIKSRFMWGITADIQAPDYETRVAILLSKAEAENIEVTPDVRAVIELIAERIKKNVRELESSFSQVVTLAPLVGEEINVSFAKKTLKNILRNKESVITVEGIKRAVCKYYNVKMQDMDSKKRMRAIAYPRQIAMYLAKEMTDYSLPKIGESFGGRDHTTVLYACNKIREDIKMSEALKDDIEELKSILQ